MTMLERVAEVVSHKVMECSFGDLEGGQRDYVLSIARAAIEALMEPTERMVIAGHSETPYCHASHEECKAIIGDRSCHQAMTDAYQAMLKAVLEEK